MGLGVEQGLQQQRNVRCMGTSEYGGTSAERFRTSQVQCIAEWAKPRWACIGCSVRAA